MTQYMFSVIHGELDYAEDELQSIVAAVDAFNEKVKEQTVFAGGLEEPETATTVDGTGESVVVTDGPFLEAKEALGGLYVLECASSDEAVELAKQVPRSPGLVVQLSPIAGT